MPAEATPRFLSTYRVQLHQEWGFNALREILPYLARLGVAFIYTSPVLAARRGSMHGYDVIDPETTNPELGGEPGRLRLRDALTEHRLGWLLDIVPNHMATGAENPYWDDVLRHGRQSPYAAWFDVDWNAAPLRSAPHSRAGDTRARRPAPQVTLPILGEELDEALAQGRLSLARTENELRLRYGDSSLPIAPETAETLPDDLGSWSAGPGSVDRMHALLAQQHYRLTSWRRAGREINYRRFFDVNDLAGLRMEDPAVFDTVHRATLQWVVDGSIHGLRVDHIDGLRRPLAYLVRLRDSADARAPERIPILVEKILTGREGLRCDWPVDGTTGYEVLNALESMFVAPEGYAAIQAAYVALSRFPGVEDGFAGVAARAKRKILRDPLRADVRRLARLAGPVVRALRPELRPRQPALVVAIEHIIAALAVYRTYVDAHAADARASGEDERLIRDAADRAAREPTSPGELVRILESILLGGDSSALPLRLQQRRAAFMDRLQQTCAPAMAKGVEDTALYQYVPLVSLNEVGGTPDRPLRDAVPHLHEANANRAAHWPRSLITTSTHDTKRSADVRARLDVLSEIPDEWIAAVHRWRRMNRRWRGRAGRRVVPDPNTEYLLYQTVVGVWPLDRSHSGDSRHPGESRDPGWSYADLRERVMQYMLKAVREGKQRSRWTDADADYERSLGAFLAALFDPERSGRWLADVTAFATRVQYPGLWNSLSRVAVHLTAPGVPDIYQGDELWSFALVDPDNRTPVDYTARIAMLAELENRVDGDGVLQREQIRAALEAPWDGRIKMYITMRLLNERRTHADVFASGAYLPVEARGASSDHTFAFMRNAADDHMLTVVARLPVLLMRGPAPPVGRSAWGDTRILLPGDAPRRWRCVLTGRTVTVVGSSGAPELPMGELLSDLPVAVLASHDS